MKITDINFDRYAVFRDGKIWSVWKAEKMLSEALK